MATLFDLLGNALTRSAERNAKHAASKRSAPRAAGVMGKMLKLLTLACAAVPSEVACSQMLPRRSYARRDMETLAKEALEFKESHQQYRFWQREFLFSKHGKDLLPSHMRGKQCELKAALRHGRAITQGTASRYVAPSDVRPYASGAGTQQFAKPRAEPSNRKRVKYDRTNRKCQELDEEVWVWFVDRLATNKSRVCTTEVMTTAESYKQAVLQDWRTRCDNGHADSTKPPHMPKINNNWVTRWRRRYNVSYRTVNLRYKIPRATFMERLKVFWSNMIIVRRLHELLCPEEGPLCFVGFDQKPLWFNAITGERTMAHRGQKKAGVAENVSASRARFTAMTYVRSWVEDTIPGLAVLFKIGDAACSQQNLIDSLDVPDNVFLQGGPCGSYRLENVLEFLEWVLKPFEETGRRICVVLDWFAPHLHDAVDQLCHSKGHAVCRIGGGLTPNVQVGDTHAHRPYNNHYRNLETSAAVDAWNTRPGTLLDCSRQTVLDRSWDAWRLVDHDKNVAGWLHNGCAFRSINYPTQKISGKIINSIFPFLESK